MDPSMENKNLDWKLILSARSAEKKSDFWVSKCQKKSLIPHVKIVSRKYLVVLINTCLIKPTTAFHFFLVFLTLPNRLNASNLFFSIVVVVVFGACALKTSSFKQRKLHFDLRVQNSAEIFLLHGKNFALKLYRCSTEKYKTWGVLVGNASGVKNAL